MKRPHEPVSSEADPGEQEEWVSCAMGERAWGVSKDFFGVTCIDTLVSLWLLIYFNCRMGQRDLVAQTRPH